MAHTHSPLPLPLPLRFPRLSTIALALAGAGVLSACATAPQTANPPAARTAHIERTAHGVPHITAPDMETLAYGVAYAHAQDNVCQTADHLVTVRGQRAIYFGAPTQGLLGRRMLPNLQIDLFIAAHMDDAALERSWSAVSTDAQSLARGYVAGYNRYLADHAAQLPVACKGQPWVTPMSLADFRRLNELTSVQASSAALADAILGAQAPAPAPAKAANAAQPASAAPPALLADAAQAMRDAGLLDSPLGSNAWAFGKDTTANGKGMLLGNPHFPWQGPNRFWQMHLTIPGQLDVMGAAIGHGAAVQIGFNKDVAWSHTVSTGKRFTLHELTLVPGQPTQYLVDGQPEAMRSRTVQASVRQADGSLKTQSHTVWSTRWGPVLVIPRAGLTWSAARAYALQDVNTLNARFTDTWLGFARATDVHGLRQSMVNLGLPWVNTLGADRQGNALYADVSVVPDVSADKLKTCAPSPQAAALLPAAGLVVLDGSRSSCGWTLDAASPVAGVTPITRMPIAVRSDWVHNSNDSFFYTHPAQRFEGISPLVGDASVTRPRTRAGLTEIPEMVARGKVTLTGIQAQLYQDRNFMASITLPDLLAACASTPPADALAQAGCAALKGWSGRNTADARGAHLFREFWRDARNIPGVWRVAFDPAQPAATPHGLKLDNPEVNTKVWAALTQAVKRVQDAGFALDAPLASVQTAITSEAPIGLHGGDEFEGVLNNIGTTTGAAIAKGGVRIDYGSSYVQAVTWDDKGPVAHGLLTYSQSTDPASPHSADQTRVFASGQAWPRLPFHADEVARTRVGEVLRLTRP
jgi:acyl-homoserine-lactone acylase